MKNEAFLKFLRNEAEVGQAIKDSGLKREDIFVVTKLQSNAHGYNQCLEAFNLSLKKWVNGLLQATRRAYNPGGGDSAYERGGDACRKFWIKPLKETDPGVAQTFFDP